jgi:hypothetical protein
MGSALIRPSHVPNVLLSHRSGDDFLEIHSYRPEKLFWQIRTMEAYRFIGIASVIVIPIEQRRRGSGREFQCVHGQRAASVSQALERSSLLIMLITVHGTTPRFSSIEIQHCTALMFTSVI